MAKKNRYEALIEAIFDGHFCKGSTEFVFLREDIENFAQRLRVKLPKNLGDLIYSFRYRAALPKSIRNTCPSGKEWVIHPAGRSKYRFQMIDILDFKPNPTLAKIKLPNATPGIIATYSLSDEQALLAKIRYNRLIDIFTRITCYSLQNHLRTTVPGIGQVETDEMYVGVDRNGAHYVFPVQAKGGKDKLSVVQVRQDMGMCKDKFPDLSCRPIGAQFLSDGAIALFEFSDTEEGMRIISEKQYRLVTPEEITEDDLKVYRQLREDQ
jgi:hypothetical protein